MSVNVSRRAFLLGSAAVAGSAVAEKALGAEKTRWKVCEPSFDLTRGFHEKCWHETRNTKTGTVELEDEKEEEAKGGNGIGREATPNLQSKACKYFEQIGRAIVEGRYNGKLDAIDITRPTNKKTSETFRIWLKPFQGNAFDKATCRRAGRCNDGVQQPQEDFDRHYLAVLGQKAYLAEETMPDKPKGWDPEKPYVQAMYISSEYRHAAYNKSCGGKKHSRHLLGFAMDVIHIGKADAKMVYGAAISNEGGQNQGGISYYAKDNFTHIDPDNAPREDWQGNGTAFVLARKAAFKVFQARHGITPFSLERDILKAPRAAMAQAQPHTVEKLPAPEKKIARAQNAGFNPAPKAAPTTVRQGTATTGLQPVMPQPQLEVAFGPADRTPLLFDKRAVAQKGLEILGNEAPAEVSAFVFSR